MRRKRSYIYYFIRYTIIIKMKIRSVYSGVISEVLIYLDLNSSREARKICEKIMTENFPYMKL